MSNGSAKVALCCCLIGYTACSSILAAAPQVPQRFSIEDSIALSRIVNPTTWSVNEERPEGTLASPNGNYFLVVTQRGVLSSNSLEATVWLVERQAIANAFADRTDHRVLPRALVTFAASSNAPVISDVRWLPDSQHVAFIGRDKTVRANLYVLDVLSGTRTAIAKASDYVTGYDIQGDTIAYTTLIAPKKGPMAEEDLQSVAGQGGIYQLLYPPSSQVGDMDDEAEQLLTAANELHIVRGKKEILQSLLWQGQPLRLYDPILSLSPDGAFLITIAPVHKIPPQWSAYVPGDTYVPSTWSSANHWETDERNPWKAAQYVIVNLSTGEVTSLINAPAGPGTFYFLYATTKILWSHDGRRVLLTNASCPAGASPAKEVTGVVATVDITTQACRRVSSISRDQPRTRYLSDASWDPASGEVDLHYISYPDKVLLPQMDRYQLRDGRWLRDLSRPRAQHDREIAVQVLEGPNQPPVLAASANPDHAAMIWDPNPQLNSKMLGTAVPYSWGSRRTGSRWSGILVLPPNYDRTVRYPLVIQTHGYEKQRFYTDGIYTTGSGGRALAASDIVVLQTGESLKRANTPEEGPAALDELASAVQALSSAEVVDPRRVGVIGFSYTCFEVMYALTHSPRLFSTATITDGNNKGYLVYLMAVDIGGQSNPFLAPLEHTYGSRPFGSGLRQWSKETPTFNLDQVKASLQIWSLERGSLMGQWEIYAGLRAWQKPVDMVWLSSQRFIPHVVVKPHDRYLSQQGAVDWFRFWLQGYESKDLRKAEQYTRWEQMCDVWVHENPDRKAWCVRRPTR